MSGVTTWLPPHRSPRFLILVFVAGIGLGMTAPLTALFAVSLGAGSVGAGLAVSSIGATLLVSDLFGATFVTRLPGRLLLWLSLTIFAAGALASAAAPGLAAMIGARMCQGVGAVLFMTGGLSVVLRSCPPQQTASAIGAFNACWYGGMAVGPLIGGWVAQAGGFRMAFAVCGVLSAVVALLCRWQLPPLPSPVRPLLSLPTLPRAKPGRRLGPLITLTVAGQLMRGTLAPALLPLFGSHDLGLRVGTVGAALSVLSLSDVLTMRQIGRMADRFPRRTLLGCGFAIAVAACGLSLLVHGAIAFVAWCVLMGIGLAMTTIVPTAMLVEATSDPERAVGSFRVLSDLTTLIGPVSAGALAGAAGATTAVSAIGAVALVACAQVAATAHTKPVAQLMKGTT